MSESPRESPIFITSMELIPLWNRNQKTVAVFSAQFFGWLTVHDFILRWNKDADKWIVRYPTHYPVNLALASASQSSTTVLSMKQNLFNMLIFEAVEEYFRRVDSIKMEKESDMEPIMIEQEQ